MSDIERFIQAVQNEEFAPAHEILEHDWLEYKKLYRSNDNPTAYKKAKALQGLINGTTALALYKKGKIESYEKVWSTFLKYEHYLDEITLPQHDYFLQAQKLLHIKNQNITS